jgi:hypothetical protein
MQRILARLMIMAAGALAGMASAVWSIELYGSGRAAPGSTWQSWDVSSDNGSHPYSMAHFLMAGRFPPAEGEMLEFSTQQASDGSALSGRCDYLLTVKQAPTGWWSIAAYAAGVTSPPFNSVITSDTIIAEHDGTVKLSVSRSPTGGNWVEPPVPGGFVLLYTVAEPAPSQSAGVVPQFTVQKAKCSS